MNKLLLVLSILCVSATGYAQQGKVERVELGGMTIDVGRAGHPDVDHSGTHGSGGNQQSSPRDPYPALTRANNAYNQAVAVWQQAYQNYQAALANQARLKDRYVDSNGNVRPGLDRYAALTVLSAAEKEVQDAYLELDKAQSNRNAAYAVAAQEFKKATEQYARQLREASGGGASGSGASQRGQQQGQPQKERCPRC